MRLRRSEILICFAADAARLCSPDILRQASAIWHAFSSPDAEQRAQGRALQREYDHRICPFVHGDGAAALASCQTQVPALTSQARVHVERDGSHFHSTAIDFHASVGCAASVRGVELHASGDGQGKQTARAHILAPGQRIAGKGIAQVDIRAARKHCGNQTGREDDKWAAHGYTLLLPASAGA